MAGAGFYSSRVNAQVVAAPAPRPALGVGELVSALGRSAGAVADQNRQTDEKVSAIDDAIAEREKARARDAVSAKVAVRLAEGEGEYARFVIDNQNDAQFESKANARVEADMAALRGMLGDDTALIDHYEPIMVRMAESRKTAAHGHVAAVRAKEAGATTEALLTASGNAVSTAPERTGEFAELVTTTIMANQSIPEALRPGLAQQATGALWQQGLEADIRLGRGPAVGKKLRAGAYDTVLPEGAKPALLRLVDASATVAVQQAEAAQADAKRAAVEAGALLKIRALDRHEPVSLTEITAVMAQMRAAGVDPSEILTFATLGEDQLLSRGYVAMKTPELQAARATLQAKIDGGADRNGTGVRQVDLIDKVLKERTTKQADTLAPLLKGGVESRTDGLAQMNAMPPAERWKIAEAAGDLKAGVSANLGRRGRAFAAQGGVLRAGRPAEDFLPPKSATVTNPSAEVDRIIKDELGGEPLARIGGTYEATREVALDIMAATGGKWQASNLRRALQVVAGWSPRGDGSGQGGVGTVRGRKVELPGQWNEHEFDLWLSRNDFAGAIYGDGNPVRPADVRDNYALRVVGTGTDGSVAYALVNSAGEALSKKGGGAYSFTVSARPPMVKR